MGDAAQQAAEIRRTVRRARGYWSRAGVPRKTRRRRAEELHEHLTEAVRDGRRIEDVTGADLPAFAAEWSRAEHARPLVEPALWAAGAVVITPGLLALVGPLAFGHDRTGFDTASITFMGVVMATIFLIHLLRWQRHRLSRQEALAARIGLVAGYALLAVPVLSWGRRADLFVAVPPPAAWSLVAVGTAIQVLLTALKRTGRL